MGIPESPASGTATQDTSLPTTLKAIAHLSDDDLLDRYLNFTLKSELDLTDRVIITLLREEWNKRHPEDPMAAN